MKGYVPLRLSYVNRINRGRTGVRIRKLDIVGCGGAEDRSEMSGEVLAGWVVGTEGEDSVDF